MSRYFFHLRDHTDEILDPEGLELPAEAISGKALDFARDSLSHDIREGMLDLRYRIDVENAAGSVVHSLPFGDAFEIIPS